MDSPLKMYCSTCGNSDWWKFGNNEEGPYCICCINKEIQELEAKDSSGTTKSKHSPRG